MAAASSLMQEEGPYGASDSLDHPYGWTVVDTTSMYSNKTTLNFFLWEAQLVSMFGASLTKCQLLKSRLAPIL